MEKNKAGKALNVAIVGGGPGCKAIMDMIFAEKLSQLRMKIIGVACRNPQAVGYRHARDKGIYTTKDHRDLYKIKDLNMIIELTNSEEVANEISKTKPEKVRLMDHVAARLFWDVFRLEEERFADRREAEAALKASEQRYRALFEDSPISLWEEDFSQLKKYFGELKAKGVNNFRKYFDDRPEEVANCIRMTKIQDVNKATLELYEADTKEELLGGLKGIMPEKANEILKEPVIDMAQGKIFEVEYLSKTLKNNRLNVLIKSSIPLGYEETWSKVLISVQNLTDRIQAEREKKKMEAQMHQAQKIESIGTLAGGIAHDFNNLLMGILGNASLLLYDSDPSDPNYEKLKNIEQYVENGTDLTKQLLGFARGGKYEVKPTNLNDLIEKTSKMFGRTRKELNIFTKYEKKIWIVEVDEGQIEQVLLNLYVNAWQAMPDGGDLYLQVENIIFDEDYSKMYELEAGKYVKIFVTDTGLGMDEATRQRIFDPFFTTKEKGRGTGLGLASSYGIIKNHNGAITVYSVEGEGTTFNIYIPASKKEIAKEKKFSEQALKGTETILLVDDEEMIIDIGQQMLKTLGYTVLVAFGGKEAIKFYTRNQDKIGLVILDMIMPDMGGDATFNKLKEINPDIKVLLSSGYSINGKAAKILKRGCDGFIQKPFNMIKLSQKIRKILDKK